MVLAVIGCFVCLMLPSLTNNRVSFDEAMLGLIPAVIVFLLGFAVTVTAGFFVIKARKTVR